MSVLIFQSVGAGPLFDQLPLAIRYDIYLRERALTPGTPDWELETWTWKQTNPEFRKANWMLAVISGLWQEHAMDASLLN